MATAAAATSMTSAAERRRFDQQGLWVTIDVTICPDDAAARQFRAAGVWRVREDLQRRRLAGRIHGPVDEPTSERPRQ
jgi:hypothetical protein